MEVVSTPVSTGKGNSTSRKKLRDDLISIGITVKEKGMPILRAVVNVWEDAVTASVDLLM